MKLEIPDRVIAGLLLLGGIILVAGLVWDQKGDLARVSVGSAAALAPGLIALRVAQGASRSTDSRWTRLAGWSLVGLSIPCAWFLYGTARWFCP
jgi:hypothetical protein